MIKDSWLSILQRQGLVRRSDLQPSTHTARGSQSQSEPHDETSSEKKEEKDTVGKMRKKANPTREASLAPQLVVHMGSPI